MRIPPSARPSAACRQLFSKLAIEGLPLRATRHVVETCSKNWPAVARLRDSVDAAVPASVLTFRTLLTRNEIQN
jgi:hypothetical protein